MPSIDDGDIAAVVDVLRSGWVTTGPKAKEFETRFVEFLGGGLEAVAVNSATAALHLGLEALGVAPGDEVITTTHTFTATAEIIRYLGADPVFVDIDPKTLCIDVAGVERAITPRTKAIIPVHFAGRAAEMEGLIRIAKERGVRILEDAAHALPTTCGGKLVGALDTDAAAFSFYANKTITTGEGGMLVTRDPSVATRARVMRLHGISRDVFDRFSAKAPSWHYEVVAPGYKYNMTDVAAALGVEQLKRAHAFQSRRAEIAAAYNEAFAKLPVSCPPGPAGNDVHSWHLYVIRLAAAADTARDRFIEDLFRAGIGCSVHYIPLHLQPYWRDRYRLAAHMFPVSQSVYESTVSLPIYSRMTDADVNRVIAGVREALNC
jgi:dTDP-4-amino-4,6-dideoxygalactose transaminase